MRISIVAVAIVSALSAAPTSALDLSVVEYANDFNTVLSDHQVNNILVFDADQTPKLNLQRGKNPKHQALINLLSPGLSIDKPQVREEIAEILAAYPQQCLAVGALALAVEPIGDVCGGGETDNRRVTQLLFTGCLDSELEDCAYDLSRDGGCDFELGGLKAFLTSCRRSLTAAVDNGATWSAKVYQQSPAFRNLTSLNRVRDYFLRKHLRTILPPAAVPSLNLERCGPRKVDPVVFDACAWRERDNQEVAEREGSKRREASIHAARDQIAQARHDAAALFLRGDKEAAYYTGCLSKAHTGHPPDAIGAIPRESNAALRYDCAFYDENDYRATYLNSDWHGLDHGHLSYAYEDANSKRVVDAFSLASKSPDPKLAARAFWNLAVLALLDAYDEHGKEKAKKALEEARRLDPEAFLP